MVAQRRCIENGEKKATNPRTTGTWTFLFEARNNFRLESASG